MLGFWEEVGQWQSQIGKFEGSQTKGLPAKLRTRCRL